MSVDPPPGLAAVLERIVAPEERSTEVPADVTGELARLLLWWRSLSDGAPLAQWIDDEPPADPVDARRPACRPPSGPSMAEPPSSCP